MVFEKLKSLFTHKPKKTEDKDSTTEYKSLVKIGKPRKIEERGILVSDLMTRKIISVNPDMTLDKVVDLFIENNISGAPVLDRDFFIGEISKTDILFLVDKNSLEDLTTDDRMRLAELKVADIMKKPICINEDEPVEEAERKMNKYNIRRLLVLDDKTNLVGIITRTDLLKGKSKEEIKDHISTKIDKMLDILEREGKKTFKELSDVLGIPENIVEDWSKVLEDHGLVEIEYTPIGSPSVKFKKHQ